MRLCETCGGSMEGKRPHAVYCSRACKLRASDRRRIEDGRAHERDHRRYRSEAGHRREYAQTYHRAHPEMVWEWRLRKRARRIGALVFVVTFRDWRRLMARYGGRCAYCGAKTELTCDHVTPLSRGGAHSIGNILPVCARCNTAKRSRLLIEWKASDGCR